MERLHGRGERGASILASLIIAATLGGAALLANLVNVQPESQFATSQTAAPDDPEIKECEVKVKDYNIIGYPRETIYSLIYVVRKGSNGEYTSQQRGRANHRFIDEKTGKTKCVVYACAEVDLIKSSPPGVIRAGGTGEKCSLLGESSQGEIKNLANGDLAKNFFGNTENFCSIRTLAECPDVSGVGQPIPKTVLGESVPLNDAFNPGSTGYDSCLAAGDPGCGVQGPTAADQTKKSLEEIAGNCPGSPGCPGHPDNTKVGASSFDEAGFTQDCATDPEKCKKVEITPSKECPAGQTGTPPTCTPTATGCPAGQTGTPPDCKTPDPGPGNRRPGGNDTTGGNPQTTGNSGGQNPFSQLMQALGKLLAGNQQPQAPTCPTDPNAYQQAQQQYNQQLQQYNQQLQQYNYQQQFQGSQSFGSQPPPTAPVPCKPATPPPPPTPPPAAPKAEISCQPKVADAGMTISISYSCSAGTSEGSGFETLGAKSGATTTILAAPQGNANTATYTLTCKDGTRTSKADCSVQVARLGIVLIANPEAVKRKKTSRIGWVTSGMKSCVISSPDLSEFTADNAGNTSVNGTATTPPLTRSADFVLKCETLGGATKERKITVNVI